MYSDIEFVEFVLAFASVSTNPQIEYCSTCQRHDRADSGNRETQPRFLVIYLRIRGLIFCRVRHRYRRSIKHVNRSTFPQPCGIDFVIECFSNEARDTRKELLRQTLSSLTVGTGFRRACFLSLGNVTLQTRPLGTSPAGDCAECTLASVMRDVLDSSARIRSSAPFDSSALTRSSSRMKYQRAISLWRTSRASSSSITVCNPSLIASFQHTLSCCRVPKNAKFGVLERLQAASSRPSGWGARSRQFGWRLWELRDPF